ncbi:diguanylate cyclase domain-containing protein [Leptothrix ochracea]|uniref:bifunctional diguanylate cyclase/phosphodiesterase n=3 Tax=Leptothrix ochracea TaxID=735331 RepID=UPI0034E1B457
MRRAKYGLTLLGLVIAFLLLIGQEAYRSWQVVKADAATDARNLTQILASRLELEFGAAERVVSVIAADFDPKLLRPERVRREQSSVSRWLRSHRHAITSASALRIFDAAGNRLYTSMDGEQGVLNIADRDFFQAICKQPTAAKIFYSDVLTGRYTGRASMYISQPLLDAQKHFLGAVIAVIDVSVLQEDLQKLDLGPGGVIALRRMDNGALLIRYPGKIEIQNKPDPQIPIRMAILQKHEPRGTLEVASPIDGVQRTLGYQVLANQPFFITVGLAEDTYSAEWREHVRVLGFSAMAFIGILGGVFYRLYRSELKQAQDEHALRDSEERFRTIADYTYDWEYWLSPEGGVLYVSPACERVSGYTPEEFYADPGLLDRIVLPEDIPLYREHLHTLETHVSAQVVFRIVCKSRDVRWIAHGCRRVIASDGRDLGRRVNNRDITDLKLAEQRAHELAFFDALTGLPNRRMLLDRLDQALLQATRFQRPMAVMFIDVDHFKAINDRFGHEAGDTLLRQIALRLVSCVRSVDTVARSGGDEFIVILSELTDPQDVRLVAEKMALSFHDPIPFGTDQLHATLSIGIAVRAAHGSEGAATLMRRADMAMYAIKSAGRNGHRIWSPGDGTTVAV